MASCKWLKNIRKIKNPNHVKERSRKCTSSVSIKASAFDVYRINVRQASEEQPFEGESPRRWAVQVAHGRHPAGVWGGAGAPSSPPTEQTWRGYCPQEVIFKKWFCQEPESCGRYFHQGSSQMSSSSEFLRPLFLFVFRGFFKNMNWQMTWGGWMKARYSGIEVPGVWNELVWKSRTLQD